MTEHASRGRQGGQTLKWLKKANDQGLVEIINSHRTAAQVKKAARQELMERKGEKHPEAFCLMRYRCHKCARVEVLWNSRDGVTPFILSCKHCGGEASHTDWQSDIRAEKHAPTYGERIFVDLTEKRRRAIAVAYFDRHWDESLSAVAVYKGKTKEEALELYLNPSDEMLRPSGAEPDIRTIGVDLAWLSHIPKGAGLQDIADALDQQLCPQTKQADLERIADALERGEGFPSAELDDLERPTPEETMADRVSDELEKMRKAAAERGRVLRLKLAGEQRAVYVLALRNEAGQVVESHEAPNTEEGRASLATALLLSLSPERIAKTVEEALRIKSGKLPPELVEALKEPRGRLKPIEAPGIGDRGRFLKLTPDDAMPEDMMLAVTPGHGMSDSPKMRAVLDGLADGMKAKLERGEAVEVQKGGPIAGGILARPAPAGFEESIARELSDELGDQDLERLAEALADAPCEHNRTRADVNMVTLLDGRQELRIRARCDLCRHRYVFRRQKPGLNKSKTEATLAVKIGPPETLKVCAACGKDHDRDAAVCAACETEANAKGKENRRG